MASYIIKRLGTTIVVLLLVMVFLSLLTQIVPGDPAVTLLGPRATPELIEKVRIAMDLDQPAYVQVWRFVWRTLHGNLGTDFWTGREMTAYVGDVFWHTFILAWGSLGLAVLLGIPLGIFSATHPNSWLDRSLAILSITFITFPSYVVALILLRIFAVDLRVLPAIGAGDITQPVDYLRHLILPAVALSLTWIGYLARLVRTSLLEVLTMNYVRAARAFGIKQKLILYKYALKNALVPTVAVLGMGIGSLMGGAMLTEVIFTRPGMGSLIYNAILARNYPLVRAGVLIVAILFVGANLLADVCNSLIDPRIQLGKSTR